MKILLAVLIVILVVIAIEYIRYRNKINNRIRKYEDMQRYGKPNWTKWWNR